MSPNQTGEVVRLAQANDPVEAHTWRQALEEEGIECHVVGDYLDMAMGGVSAQPELWVHRNDLERAEEILQGGQEARGERGDEEKSEQE